MVDDGEDIDLVKGELVERVGKDDVVVIVF